MEQVGILQHAQWCAALVVFLQGPRDHGLVKLQARHDERSGTLDLHETAVHNEKSAQQVRHSEAMPQTCELRDGVGSSSSTKNGFELTTNGSRPFRYMLYQYLRGTGRKAHETAVTPAGDPCIAPHFSM